MHAFGIVAHVQPTMFNTARFSEGAQFYHRRPSDTRWVIEIGHAPLRELTSQGPSTSKAQEDRNVRLLPASNQQGRTDMTIIFRSRIIS